MHRHLLIALAILTAATQSAQAQDGPPKWSVGAIGFYETSPFAAEENEFEAFPFLAYRGDRFFIEGPKLGYRLTDSKENTEGQKIDLGISLVAAMRTLPGESRNKITADIGIEMELETMLGAFEFTALHDATDTSNGIELSAGYSYDFNFGKLTLTPSIEAAWQNRKLSNYLWGVTAEQHARMIAKNDTVLPVYQPNSETWIIETAIMARYQLSGRWMLLSIAGVEFLDSSVTNNPGINKDHIFEAGLGLTYSF